MNFNNRNIKALFASLVFAAFVISFTHAFLEQIETGCAQHENHDFSMVIVNTVLTYNNLEKSPLGNCQYHFSLMNTPFEIVLETHNLKFLDYMQSQSPYPDKIYLTKSGSLII